MDGSISFRYLIALFLVALTTGFQHLPPSASIVSTKEIQTPSIFTEAGFSRVHESSYSHMILSASGSADEIVAVQKKPTLDELPKANGKTAKKATPRKASNKKRTANKRSTAKNDKAPIHWRHESDECVFREASVDNDIINATTTSLLRFTVRGNPLPLRRHRTSRGFMYNPSAKAQTSFREIVQTILFEDNLDDSQPLFGEEHALSMTIVFRMKRPKRHFVGGKPGPGRLRETAPPCTSVTRTDVDNLAKFVLDSMNGLLYHDDRQIASLHVTKLLDNEEECRGSTEVLVRVLKEDDLSTLLMNTFELY